MIKKRVKKDKPKVKNVAAKNLSLPENRPKVVKSKKIYNRKKDGKKLD